MVDDFLDPPDVDAGAEVDGALDNLDHPIQRGVRQQLVHLEQLPAKKNNKRKSYSRTVHFSPNQDNSGFFFE